MLLLVSCTNDSASRTANIAQPTVIPTIVAASTPLVTFSSTSPRSTPMPAVTAIKMLDAQNGWLFGTTEVWRTENSGKDWINVTPPDASPPTSNEYNQLKNIATIDKQTVRFALSNRGTKKGAIVSFYRTDDGGRNWSSSTIDINSMVFADPGRGYDRCLVLSLAFGNADEGWMLTTFGQAATGHRDLEMFGTKDGGKTWKAILPATPVKLSADLMFSGMPDTLTFVDAQHGWMTGWWHTRGIPYSVVMGEQGSQELPLPANFYSGSATSHSPAFFDPLHGILPVRYSGQDGGSYLLFYHSQDAGKTWTPTSVPRQSNTTIWSWVNPQSGFLVEGADLLVTKDGAQTWDAVTTNTSLKGTTQLQFVTDQLGWVVRDGYLLKTTDGGHTWTLADP
jgi:photosystem II stability/assembly factor-like uncharacterized protein